MKYELNRPNRILQINTARLDELDDPDLKWVYTVYLPELKRVKDKAKRVGAIAIYDSLHSIEIEIERNRKKRICSKIFGPMRSEVESECRSLSIWLLSAKALLEESIINTRGNTAAKDTNDKRQAEKNRLLPQIKIIYLNAIDKDKEALSPRRARQRVTRRIKWDNGKSISDRTVRRWLSELGIV